MIVILGFSVQAANDNDISLIRETARNYMESWYQGDPEMMKKTLHKKLAKRSVKTGFDGNSSLGFTTRTDMISYTRSGYGTRLWEQGHEIEVTVLDHHENIASVLVVSPHYHEYLHLARIDRRWVIVNALYE
jgi:hypothetical protein